MHSGCFGVSGDDGRGHMGTAGHGGGMETVPNLYSDSQLIVN
jgi:hypothetical protein